MANGAPTLSDFGESGVLTITVDTTATVALIPIDTDVYIYGIYAYYVGVTAASIQLTFKDYRAAKVAARTDDTLAVMTLAGPTAITLAPQSVELPFAVPKRCDGLKVVIVSATDTGDTYLNIEYSKARPLA